MVDFGKHHIQNLVAKDLEETSRFYIDKLGFRDSGEMVQGRDDEKSIVLSRDEATVIVLDYTLDWSNFEDICV